MLQIKHNPYNMLFTLLKEWYDKEARYLYKSDTGIQTNRRSSTLVETRRSIEVYPNISQALRDRIEALVYLSLGGGQSHNTKWVGDICVGYAMRDSSD